MAYEPVAWDFELAAETSIYLRQMALSLERTHSDIVRVAALTRVAWHGPHRLDFDARLERLNWEADRLVDALRHSAARLESLSADVQDEDTHRQRHCSR